MKLFLIFLSFIVICGCDYKSSNKEKSANIYITGCNGIFYCEGQHLNLNTLKEIPNNDSIFINKKIEEFQKNNKQIYIKIFGGNCGGNAGTAEELTLLFDRKHIKWQVVEPDSMEEKHFNDISLSKAIQQRHIELNEPKEEINTGINKPFFQFLLKKNGAIYYSYDSTDMNRGLSLINHPTIEKLVEALNKAELKYNIKLDDENLMIRGDASASYHDFKVIKDALKAKNIFKFKIVTNELSQPKKPEVETSVAITAKTLTLLVSATDDIFYFYGTDCSSIKTISITELQMLLQKAKLNTPAKDLMVVIKEEEGSSFKTAIDILDEINLSNIPARHFAETDISPSEIVCIKNYKNK